MLVRSVEKRLSGLVPGANAWNSFRLGLSELESRVTTRRGMEEVCPDDFLYSYSRC